MDPDIIKKVFICVVNNIDTLNDILREFNDFIDVRKLAIMMDNNEINIESSDSTVYIGSVLYYLFDNKLPLLKVESTDSKKIIIINYLNTILEDNNIKEIQYEV